MKLTTKHHVDVTLTLSKEEAVWLAQLCVQIGGVNSPRKMFYHDVWRTLSEDFRRNGAGDVPATEGKVFYLDEQGLCVGDEPAQQASTEQEKK